MEGQTTFEDVPSESKKTVMDIFWQFFPTFNGPNCHSTAKVIGSVFDNENNNQLQRCIWDCIFKTEA